MYEPGRGEKESRESVSAPKNILPSPEKLLPSAVGGSAKGKTSPEWNTTNLGLRLAADAGSAATASALVAPIICVIDRYAAQNSRVLSD